jgi:guanylate kinase
MTEKSANISTLYIISAASGAGKTSLVKALLQQDDQVRVSVSDTTRAPRPGEEQGVDYFFRSKEEFEQRVEQGDYIEHAQVFDNFYGTSESAVRGLLEQGLDVILEIDWQGAEQVRRRFDDVVSIFVLPPSRQELQNRLESRGQDSEEIIARRMRDARSEMSHYGEYDYLVVNDDFDQALWQLQTIMAARRLTIDIQSHKLEAILADLLA